MDADAELSQAYPAPPPRRGVTRVDVLCVAPIVVIWGLTLAMLPLAPSLVGTHPLLLSALRGGETDMIATGAFARVGRLPLAAAVVAPVLTLMLADPFVYWAGRRYGRRFLDRMRRGDPRWQRRLARGERLFARFGAWTIAAGYFLPVPNALLYLAAGESGMPFWLFLTADLAGTLAWIGVNVGAGWVAGQGAVNVAETVSHYGLWVTLALIAGMMVVGVRRGMAEARGRSR